jgi:hypothetical protein
MKHLKKLVLVTMAAALALVIGGAASASATALCKAAESPCSALNKYPLGTELHARTTSGGLVMKTEMGGSVIQKGECLAYTFKTKTATAGSATETVEGNYEYVEAAPCAGVFFLRLGGYSIHHIAGSSNGQYTMKNFEVLLNSSGIECVYGGTFAAGTLTGGNPATLKINGSVPKVSGGFFCPETMSLTSGPIEFTTPKPLYVAAS